MELPRRTAGLKVIKSDFETLFGIDTSPQASSSGRCHVNGGSEKRASRGHASPSRIEGCGLFSAEISVRSP